QSRSRGQQGRVSALAYAPDGRGLLVGTGTGAVLRYDPDQLRDADPLADGPPFSVTGLAFTPDGPALLTAGPGEVPPDEPELKLRDVGEGRLARALQGPVSAVNDLAVSPDGRTLATAHSRPLDVRAGGEVRLWDLASGKEVFHQATGSPTLVTFAGAALVFG